MKVAVVTTTINVPRVLLLYAKYAPDDVMFFVAGDLKTPEEAATFCLSFPNVLYLSPDRQKKWRSSEIIGWNTDSRRNFAVLEALVWGADLLISIDDDMVPYPSFFTCFARLFENNWSGMQFGKPGCWFDHGNYTFPSARARGLPLQNKLSELVIFSAAADAVHDVTIGVAQGIILGVPDTDATTAQSWHPAQGCIGSVTDVLRYGFVTHPQAYSVFNSQITAFRREVAPGCVQFYAEQGRNTDIFASLMMRNYLRAAGWYTHYGLPMGYHNRSVRDVSKDLAAERWGVENIEAFAKELDDPNSRMGESKVLSDKTKEMLRLWMADCSEAMK
jgi:hypothetical protein